MQAARTVLTMVPLLPGKTLRSRRGTFPELSMRVHGRVRGRTDRHCGEAERHAAGPGQHSFLSRCSPGNWKKMRAGEGAELKAFYSPEVVFKKGAARTVQSSSQWLSKQLSHMK